MGTNEWLIKTTENSEAKYRLFCFHYAGGSAIDFKTWGQGLGNDVEVISAQLPGRGHRMNCPLETNIHTVSDAIASEMMQWCDKPYWMFGHSMGGLIAYEVIHRLQDVNATLPKKLIISARAAPSHKVSQYTYNLPRNEFINALKQYNGIPESVLADEDLMDFFLPQLRADTELYETYDYKVRPKLSMPILAVNGAHDIIVTRKSMEDWDSETETEVLRYTINGGHFLLKENRDELIALIKEQITNEEKSWIEEMS